MTLHFLSNAYPFLPALDPSSYQPLRRHLDGEIAAAGFRRSISGYRRRNKINGNVPGWRGEVFGPGVMDASQHPFRFEHKPKPLTVFVFEEKLSLRHVCRP